MGGCNRWFRRSLWATAAVVCTAPLAVALPSAPPASAYVLTTWTVVSQLTAAGRNFQVACASVSTCVAVGTSGGSAGVWTPRIERTTDAGSTWTVEKVPASVVLVDAVACPTTTTCYVAGTADTGPGPGTTGAPAVLVTTDGGATWALQTVPEGNGRLLEGISCASPTMCVAVGNGTNGIVVTHDGGSTWTRPTVTTPTAGLTGVSCPSSTRCIAVGDSVSVGVLLTTDGGTTWARFTVVKGAAGRILAISCLNTTECEAVGTEGFVGHTTDGGTKWQATYLPYLITLTTVACATDGTCYLGGTVQTTTGYLYAIFGFTSSGEPMKLPSSAGDVSSIACPVLNTCFAAASVDGSPTFLLGAPPPPVPGCSGGGTGSPTFPEGYWLAESNGSVQSCGDALYSGSEYVRGAPLPSPVVGMVGTTDGGGYWLVSADGAVGAFGDAKNLGTMAGKPLDDPIVGMTSTPEGGYYLVASDGGIFAFGPGAAFYGSMGGRPLNEPIVGMTESPAGGYYEVASDGGIFAFGPGTPFLGSMGGKPLNKPVVGMAVDPAGGYYEVASDGGVFAFGAPFHGSTGCLTLDEPIVGLSISTDPTAVGTGTACGFDAPQQPGGYRMVASDGGVFSFGNAAFAGSLGGEGVTDVVGIATS